MKPLDDKSLAQARQALAAAASRLGPENWDVYQTDEKEKVMPGKNKLVAVKLPPAIIAEIEKLACCAWAGGNKSDVIRELLGYALANIRKNPGNWSAWLVGDIKKRGTK